MLINEFYLRKTSISSSISLETILLNKVTIYKILEVIIKLSTIVENFAEL